MKTLKKTLGVVFFLCVLIIIINQTEAHADRKDYLSDSYDTSKDSYYTGNEKNAICVGILHGGGSLVGVDYEHMFWHIGIQVGAGLFAYGAALNVHFNNNVHSSALSLVYWNQGGVGFVKETAQKVIGGMFTFRGFEKLNLQLGAGYAVWRNADFERTLLNNGSKGSNWMLMFAIGAYGAF